MQSTKVIFLLYLLCTYMMLKRYIKEKQVNKSTYYIVKLLRNRT